jgi:hypothetical protein
MSYKVVSYFTRNTPYEQESEKLRTSLEKFNIPHKIYAEDNLGNWTKNTQLKSKVILRALNEFEDDILWIDSDAIVYGKLDFFQNLNCDLSVYHLISRYNPFELLSGTLFYKNNDKVKRIVQEWINLNNSNTEWDQRNLQAIIERPENKDLIIEKLPLPYIHINNYQKHQGRLKSPAIITHYQASRRLKKIVGTKCK